LQHAAAIRRAIERAAVQLAGERDLHDFDYLPRFFLSRLPPPSNAAPALRPLAGVGCKRWLGSL
jgi:hypothetical protein